MVNFEGASFSTFRDIPKRSFCDGEVGDDSGGMSAICSQPEVADDVISSIDVDTFLYYASVNLRVAKFSSFEKILIRHLCSAQTTVGPLELHFRDQGTKTSNASHSR